MNDPTPEPPSAAGDGALSQPDFQMAQPPPLDESPSDAITMNDDDIAVVDNSKCNDEGACFDACPTEAIKPGTKPG